MAPSGGVNRSSIEKGGKRFLRTLRGGAMDPRSFRTKRRTVLAAAGAAAASSVLSVGPARADAAVVVDPVADFGRWEGWGTSLAWWANVFGDRDDLADLWFTTRTVTYQGTPLPGLGLNIARYNLGACGFTTVQGQRMVVSPNIPRFKQIEGYWQDWSNEDSNSAAWNWSVDARQRAAL